MTTFYVDLAADFVDRSGADSTTNVATGVGGLLAVIFGRGAVTTAIAAGDTCYLKGTGSLRQLANLTCGKDVAAAGWAIGDSVQDNNTGSEWTGKIIYVSTTTCYVQVNTGKTYANITTGSGIKNITREPDDTTTLSAKANLGISFNNSGSAESGWIKFIGVEGTGWTVDGTRFVLDSDAIGSTDALRFQANSFIWIQHAEIDHPDNYGINGGSSSSLYCIFYDVYIHDSDDTAVFGSNNLINALFYKCRIENSGGYSIYRCPAAFFCFCTFFNNTSGMVASSSYTHNFFGCVAISDGGNAFELNGGIAINCIADDCDGSNNKGFSSLVYRGIAVGCRSTNHSETGQIGFEGASGCVFVQIECVADNNTTGFGTYTIQFDCTNAPGDTDQGYVSPGSPDYDYNLAEGATRRSTAVVLP